MVGRQALTMPVAKLLIHMEQLRWSSKNLSYRIRPLWVLTETVVPIWKQDYGQMKVEENQEVGIVLLARCRVQQTGSAQLLAMCR